MKSSLTYLKNHLVCLGVAALLLLSVGAARAQVLLDVSISGGTVTITATGESAMAPVSSDSLFDGIDLVNFFTGDVSPNPVGSVVQSNLTVSGASAAYDSEIGDQATTGTTSLSLNLYTNGDNDTQNFATSGPAFTGSMTINVTPGLVGDLPASGSGAVFSGAYTGGSETQIGTYQIITAPEPSVTSLAAGALILVVFYRRFVRQRRVSPARD